MGPASQDIPTSTSTPQTGDYFLVLWHVIFHSKTLIDMSRITRPKGELQNFLPVNRTHVSLFSAWESWRKSSFYRIAVPRESVSSDVDDFFDFHIKESLQRIILSWNYLNFTEFLRFLHDCHNRILMSYTSHIRPSEVPQTRVVRIVCAKCVLQSQKEPFLYRLRRRRRSKRLPWGTPPNGDCE